MRYHARFIFALASLCICLTLKAKEPSIKAPLSAVGIITCSSLTVNEGRFNLGSKSLDGLYPQEFKRCEYGNFKGNHCNCFNESSEWDKVYLRSLYKEKESFIKEQTEKYWAESFKSRIFESANNVIVLDNQRRDKNLDDSILGKLSSCRIGKLFETLKKVRADGDKCRNVQQFDKMANLIFNKDEGNNKSLDDLEKEFKAFLQPLASNGLPLVKKGEENQNLCIGYKAFSKYDNKANQKTTEALSRIVSEYKNDVLYNEGVLLKGLSNAFSTNIYSDHLKSLGRGDGWGDMGEGTDLRFKISMKSKSFYNSLKQNPVLAMVLNDSEKGGMRDKLFNLETDKEISDFLNSPDTLKALVNEQGKLCDFMGNDEDISKLMCEDLERPSLSSMSASFPGRMSNDVENIRDINESIIYNEMCIKHPKTKKYVNKPSKKRKSPLEKFIRPNETVDSDLRGMWDYEPGQEHEGSRYLYMTNQLCKIMGSCRENPDDPKCSDPDVMLEDAKKRIIELAKSKGIEEDSPKLVEFMKTFPEVHSMNFRRLLGMGTHRDEYVELFNYTNFALGLKLEKDSIVASYAPDPAPEDEIGFSHIFKTETGGSDSDGYVGNYLVEGTREEEDRIVEWNRAVEAGQETATRPPFERRNFTPSTGTNTGRGNNNVGNVDTTPAILPNAASIAPTGQNITRDTVKANNSSSSPVNRKIPPSNTFQNNTASIPESEKTGSKPETSFAPDKENRADNNTRREKTIKPKEKLGNNKTSFPDTERSNFSRSSDRGDTAKSSEKNNSFKPGNFNNNNSDRKFASSGRNSSRSRSESPFSRLPPYPTDTGGGSTKRGNQVESTSGGSRSSKKSLKNLKNGSLGSYAGTKISGISSVRNREDFLKIIKDMPKEWVFDRVFKCPYLLNEEQTELNYAVVEPLALDGMKFYCVRFTTDTEGNIETDVEKKPVPVLNYWHYDFTSEVMPNFFEVYGDRENNNNHRKFYKDVQNLLLSKHIASMAKLPEELLSSVKRIRSLIGKNRNVHNGTTELSHTEMLDETRTWYGVAENVIEDSGVYDNDLIQLMILKSELQLARKRLAYRVEEIIFGKDFQKITSKSAIANSKD